MSNKPVLIVCGSRRWQDAQRLYRVLDQLDATVGPHAWLWHGGACGADEQAGHWAGCRGKFLQVWPADWSQGRQAGVKRSAEMVAAAPPGSVVVAFAVGVFFPFDPGPDNQGTAHTVRLALRRGLRVLLVDASGQKWLQPVAEAPLLEGLA